MPRTRNRNSRAATKAKLLSNEWREKLQPQVAEINMLLTRETRSRVDIGKMLLDIKESLNEGVWLVWLKEELRVLSVPTAGNYMRIALFCDNRGIVDFTNLPLSSLIALSRKQNSDEQVEMALAEAKKGLVSHKRMNEILKRPKPDSEPDQRKPAPKPKPDPDPKPSNKPVITDEDIGTLRDQLREYLMENPDLYDKVASAVKERGARFVLAGKSGPLNILDVGEPLEPFDPNAQQPPWVTDRRPTVPAYAL